MEQDDRLRDRFRALSNEEAPLTPDFPAALIEPRVRTVYVFPAWYSPRGLARTGAVAACMTLALVVGLVWGVGTGLAASRIQDGTKRAEPLPLAMLRTKQVRKALTALSCTAVAAPATGAAHGSTAQQTVPTIDLPASTARTSGTFGWIYGVREVPGGRVLVNDALHHQLKLFDSTLTTATTVLDSVPGSASSYGLRALPLLAYMGDSSISADVSAGTLLMLGPTGQIVRAVASPYVQSSPPYGNLATSLRLRYSGVDNKGRILFQGLPALVRPNASLADQVAGLSTDSIAIMRADLESRRVDTVAFVKQGGRRAMLGRSTDGGPIRFSQMPVEIVDVWGVLSDGIVGIVRGRDYHVDWISPDGTKHSTAKLPFDWKRLTDDDKLRLIDSTRIEAGAALGSALNAAGEQVGPAGGGAGRGAAAGGRGSSAPEQGPPRVRQSMEYIPPALNDIPDYYPSLRIDAAIADADGNLWILPNTSAQSRDGELVYDVVNPKGDFHRVRLPVGRSIAGFGKGGVVFLQAGDRTSGFYLERATLPHANSK